MTIATNELRSCNKAADGIGGYFICLCPMNSPNDKVKSFLRQELGKSLAAQKWEWLGATIEGKNIFKVAGINPWDFKWESLDTQVDLHDPNKNHYRVSLWRIFANEREIFFAATELSNGVYGFWELAE